MDGQNERPSDTHARSAYIATTRDARVCDGEARPSNPTLLHLCSLSLSLALYLARLPLAHSCALCNRRNCLCRRRPNSPTSAAPSIHCLVSCHHPSFQWHRPRQSRPIASVSPFLSTQQNTHHLDVCASEREWGEGGASIVTSPRRDAL